MSRFRADSYPFAIRRPHEYLGLHEATVRLWRPGAEKVFLEVQGQMVEAKPVDGLGVFEYTHSCLESWKDYKVFFNGGDLLYDPYAFGTSLGQMDHYLFSKGVHYELYDVLGAQLLEVDGCPGVRFCVWAPNARRVALAADFNRWDGRSLPMRKWEETGIWELFVPGLAPGEKYKFEIEEAGGEVTYRADPFGRSMELRPRTASEVVDSASFCWMDGLWMDQRAQKSLDIPLNIYEVHLGSWKTPGKGEFHNYRELAVRIADYCGEMGFNAVELMPVMEHPLDESWGYQVTGFFAVTRRFGSPADFQFFVNYMHQHGIAVILDWVPGHFPADGHSLARFDGTYLYEHEDTRQRLHPHWETHCFNYGRKEVSNFLIASALYWLDRFHVDGFRVDAVASMLYLDYGREEGEWVANTYGGNINLEAVEFLRHLNSVVHQRFPGCWMIAEESTSFPGVTHRLNQEGLGFDLKWNMGWMNDTLAYFKEEVEHRSFHHEKLTFGQLYAYSERFILPLSHDEVVHGKRSLLNKMPGTDSDKFAQLRLLYSYFICQPGKKLFFMGGEVGQWNEWNCKASIEWELLKYPFHKGLQHCVKDLNRLYLEHSALWERDFDHSGFEWVSLDRRESRFLAYWRHGEGNSLLCVHNFGEYPVEWARPELTLLINTDAAIYGGSGQDCYGDGIIPSFATLVFARE